MDYYFRACLVGVLAISGCVFGLAQEQFGPAAIDRLSWSPDWPEGTKELLAHESRVYSFWVNGSDSVYFDAGPQEVNELLGLFSEMAILDHEVWVESGRQTRQSFHKESVEYNVFFSSPGGISLRVPGETVQGWQLPTLYVYADPAGELFKTIKMPANLIVHSDLPECPTTDLQKPQRKPYVTRFLLKDGSPAFGESYQTKIALWEKGREQGWVLGSVGFQGIFEMYFSEAELAALQCGDMWLTVTFGNYMITPKRTDQRIDVECLTPHIPLTERNDDESLKALQESSFIKRVTFEYANAKCFVVEHPETAVYYGRVMFEDGRPAVMDPNVWKGRSSIFVSMPFHHCDVDEDGYFSAVYSVEQFAELCKTEKSGGIYLPVADKPNSSRSVAKYPVGLLSADKAKAGIIRIPEPVPPQPPNPDLTDASPLKGKPLPAWDAVALDVETIVPKDKRLLLCFWDSAQRPSRNTVQRLWEQAAFVDEKGVAVLLIHAGAEHQAADAWLNEHAIPYSNGRIEREPLEVRIAWNVQALPWLILTDAGHEVTAEGFGIEELELSLD